MKKIYRRYKTGKKRGGQHYYISRKPRRHYGAFLNLNTKEETMIKKFIKDNPKYKEASHRLDFHLVDKNEDFGRYTFVTSPEGDPVEIDKQRNVGKEIDYGHKEGTEEIPENEDLIFRGMSWDEFENAKKKGFFKSRGKYNIGEGQYGLTFGVPKASRAAFYAKSFQPIQKTPTPKKPPVVVGFDKEGWLTGDLNPDIPGDERAFPGPLPYSKAKIVYKYDIKKFKPGYQDIIVHPSGNIRESSASHAQIKGKWKKMKLENET